MAAGRISALALGLWLAGTPTVWAGVYNTAEPGEGAPEKDFRRFRDIRIELLRLGSDQIVNNIQVQSPGRKRYLAIATQASPDNLTVQERLNLGAYLIRLRQYDEAIEILKLAAQQEPKNFLVLSNLAIAYHRVNLEQRAFDTMSEALSAWPAEWAALTPAQRNYLVLQAGWDENKFCLYRHAETYYRKLLRLRLRESLASGGRPAPPQTVDALFDDGGKPSRPLRFVGESGAYEVGKLAEAERARLPGQSVEKAVQIVQQLLIWLPDDLRLYWLLGELLNAQGDVASAGEIFKDLQAAEFRTLELDKHRQELQARPQGVASSAPSTPPVTPPPDEEAKTGWTPSPWQTLGVGFVAGLAVAFLGYWQVREIQRRRHRRAVPSRT